MWWREKEKREGSRKVQINFVRLLNIILAVSFVSTLFLIAIGKSSNSAEDISMETTIPVLWSSSSEAVVRIDTSETSMPSHIDYHSSHSSASPSPSSNISALDSTEKERNAGHIKVAVFADAALNEATKQVLELVRDEGTEMVLHPGDIDYSGDPSLWEEQKTRALGSMFPYFFAPGNYEVKLSKNTTAKKRMPWPEYVEFRNQYLDKLNVACPFRTKDGSQLACNYRGVSFVLSSLSNLKGTLETDLEFLDKALNSLEKEFPAAKWTFCAWHAPFESMQVGFRSPPQVMKSRILERGYEVCRKHGAIVLTGHEHYYIRTHPVTSFTAPYKFRRPNAFRARPKNVPSGRLRSDKIPVIKISKGQTIAFVSGLGGHSVSVPSLKHFEIRKHLAVVHPANLLTYKDPGGKMVYAGMNGSPQTTSKLLKTVVDSAGYPFGALFCDLPVEQEEEQQGGGEEELGYCYFKTISGRIVDEFYLQSAV